MGKGNSKHASEAGDSNPEIFDPGLLELVPEDLKDKFKSAYSNFKLQLEEEESQHDRYRVDSGLSRIPPCFATQSNFLQA